MRPLHGACFANLSPWNSVIRRFIPCGGTTTSQYSYLASWLCCIAINTKNLFVMTRKWRLFCTSIQSRIYRQLYIWHGWFSLRYHGVSPINTNVRSLNTLPSPRRSWGWGGSAPRRGPGRGWGLGNNCISHTNGHTHPFASPMPMRV